MSVDLLEIDETYDWVDCVYLLCLALDTYCRSGPTQRISADTGSCWCWSIISGVLTDDELSRTSSQVKMIPEPIFLIWVPRGEIASRTFAAAHQSHSSLTHPTTHLHSSYTTLSLHGSRLHADIMTMMQEKDTLRQTSNMKWNSGNSDDIEWPSRSLIASHFFLNGLCRTFVYCKLTSFQLTLRVARSLCSSCASCYSNIQCRIEAGAIDAAASGPFQKLAHLKQT